MDLIRPDYRLTANAADITATIRERLVSLRLTDEAGMDSDMLEVVLADTDAARPIAVPPTGAELELSLGYDGQVQRMGLFVADEVELAGCPGEMTIRARAAVFDATPKGKTDLQSQKTRSWPAGTTLGAMAAKLAREHGLEAAVSESLRAIKLPHIDQADESDLHLLVRIAQRYDAIVKPAAGRLVLARRGESKSVSGITLPTITLRPGDCARWRVTTSRRESAGTVVAYWHAVKSAKRHEVKVGGGEPVRRLRMYYPTQEMALAAARAELARRERAQTTLALSCVGRTDLAAEARLVLEGFREGAAGHWVVTRVTHLLDDGGYRCDVEAERPSEGVTPDVVDSTD